jgi:hypothetical protein
VTRSEGLFKVVTKRRKVEGSEKLGVKCDEVQRSEFMGNEVK